MAISRLTRCLDTRCNYYNQTYEWRKAIDFLHEEGWGHLLGGAVEPAVLDMSLACYGLGPHLR